MQLIIDLSVSQYAFTDIYKFLLSNPLPSTCILKKAYPTASLASLADIVGDYIYCSSSPTSSHTDTLFYSVYNSEGDQRSHSAQYSRTVNTVITTSFPQMPPIFVLLIPSAITTPPPPPPPVEILSTENSTGLISSIRQRLAKPEVIELSDTLESDSDVELVPNDAFNAVSV